MTARRRSSPGFARASHYLGAFGNGSKMKFVANLLVAVHNVASAEAMVLGIKAGLDPDTIVKVIGSRRRHLARVRAARAADGEVRLPPADDEDRRLAEGHGDHRRFRPRARRARPRLSPRPAPVYDAAQADGLGGDDTAAVCALLERQARA